VRSLLCLPPLRRVTVASLRWQAHRDSPARVRHEQATVPLPGEGRPPARVGTYRLLQRHSPGAAGRRSLPGANTTLSERVHIKKGELILSRHALSLQEVGPHELLPPAGAIGGVHPSQRLLSAVHKNRSAASALLRRTTTHGDGDAVLHRSRVWRRGEATHQSENSRWSGIRHLTAVPHQSGNTHPNGNIRRDETTYRSGDIHTGRNTHKKGDIHQDGKVHRKGDIHQGGKLHRKGGIRQDGKVHRKGDIHQGGKLHRKGGIHQDGKAHRKGDIHQDGKVHWKGNIHQNGEVHQNRWSIGKRVPLAPSL